ncbi:hypothetical protein [Salibacter sp.]|uniref:hypothetical protein n=1 Tax=Salibacter sp. TaxID=2010995 RepID=UPI00287024BF|nr:hypothetical protein [Salibacter sp.]MDR9397849.1 hypothetical protein [Salibacter sp.]MDR9486629.1 hypothetical protein [Salibacter sp.]
MSNNQYNTLVEAIKELNNRGYKDELKIYDDLTVEDNNTRINSDDLQIDEHHRFEGMTNPADMSVLYAISKQNKKLGVVVDTYNPKEETAVSKLIQKLEEK